MELESVRHPHAHNRDGELLDFEDAQLFAEFGNGERLDLEEELARVMEERIVTSEVFEF